MSRFGKMLTIVILISLVAGILSSCASGQGGNIVIAFAGNSPHDKGGAINYQSEYAGVQMAVDQVNALGGINGKKITVIAYDDQNKTEQAIANAQAIAESNAVAVIGHSAPEMSQAAAETYNNAQIPALNVAPGSAALAGSNTFYYNIAFPVEVQAAYMANYLRKIQGESNTTLLFDNDVYSNALAEQFRNTFRGLGGRVTEIDITGRTANSVVAQIAAMNPDVDKPGTLFIAAHDPMASELIIALRRNGLSYPIAGANNLSDSEFTEKISKLPEEQAQPGYFTNNILATRSIIYDSASGQALEFAETFRKRYSGHEPGDGPTIGYDAALAVLEAIRLANFSSGQDLQQKRAAVADGLFGMVSKTNAIPGVTGPIVFDADGNIDHPARIGIYANGKIISAMTQFEPISQPAKIKNLDEMISRGRIITVGGKYAYVVNIVYSGIDIIDIREIDTKNSTYLVDFYLWFRYRPNPKDASFQPENYVFTNLQSEDSKVEISSFKPEDGNGPLAYTTYRITGRFKNEFDFRAYPFDIQDLIVRFRNQTADATSIQYVVDRIGMRDTNINSLFQHMDENGAFRSLYGWKAETAEARQDTFTTTSTLGNPQNFEQEDATRFSRFDVTVQVERASLDYIIKSLLPLLITLVLAYISFFLPLGHSERFGVGSTALLTTAFFHLNLATTLPEIGYTVLMEYFFYVSYSLSVLIIVLETLSIRLEKRGEDETDEKVKEKIQKQREQLNLIGRVSYPIILGSSILMGILIYNKILPWPLTGNVVAETPVNMILDRQATQPTSLPATEAVSVKQVTLRLGAWRPEDTQQMRAILDAFQEYALETYRQEIRVTFEPVMGTNYDSILNIQLSRGNGPDLFFVRPFSVNGEVSNYLLPINDLQDELENKFTARQRSPWQSVWGDYYGVPFVGVVQGVYYNKDIFDRLDLKVPATWEEFIVVAETLKRNNYIPIANGLNSTEDSEMFMGLLANAVGGEKGRAEYSSGQRCFNNSEIVEAFQAINDLRLFLPGQPYQVQSSQSKLLFINQRAAMLFGGSWDVKYFEQNNFNWSVFPVPAPARKQTFVIFQPDIGIGINKDSPYKSEARLFLQWLMTEDAAKAVAENLPGFYPLLDLNNLQASGPNDSAFLQMTVDYPTDVRWVMTEISDQYPRASDLMRQSLYEMARGDQTAFQAANRLQDGLAEWYHPAQICR